MRHTVSALVLAAVMAVTTAPASQAQGLAGAYLAARQASMAADFETAADYYTRALARDPGNPRLLESAAHAQLSLSRLERAIPIARKIEADGLESQIAAMVLIGADARRDNLDALIERVDGETGVGPLVDGLIKAWALLGKGDVSEALAQFDKVAAERGLEGFALYHKALALAMVGDFESAEAIFDQAAQNALQMTRRGALAHIEMLSQLERPEDALALIEKLFGTDLDPELRDMQARLAAGKTLPYTAVRNSRDGIAEVFYSVAAALSGEADEEYTILYSRVAEFLNPQHTEALLLSASLLDELELYDLAGATYAKVSPDDPAFHAAELGRAEALRRSDRLEEAGQVLNQLAKTHGDLSIVHVTLGDLRRQQDDYGAAIDAYDAALALSDGDSPAQWFVYYARGISFERLDRWPQAEADFRKALELNPEHPQILNYLGYSLVEERVKLDEALELIERAVDASPDSGYIVDSLGWVLYRLGRYEEAVPHMERAAELMPVDPVVNDHLGDVLWAVGRKREAEFQWKRALSFIDEEDPQDDVEPERIRQKLEIGLDAVLDSEGAVPLRAAQD